jgi:hypothetical protein
MPHGQGVRFLSAPPIHRTAQTVRLPCLPAKQCVPAVGYSDHARGCPPRRRSSKARAARRYRADRRSTPRGGSNKRGSVTCGAQDAGCNPVAFGRVVQLGLSPPFACVFQRLGIAADNRATVVRLHPQVPILPGSWRNRQRSGLLSRGLKVRLLPVPPIPRAHGPSW